MIIKAALVVADAQGQMFAPGYIRFESNEGNILEIGSVSDLRKTEDEEILDLGEKWLIPGLIQAHIHFNQTLFRGLAENLELLPWLERRIWPLEAAHNDASVFASASETAAELLLTGATSALSMETTRYSDAVFRACHTLGLRAVIGPALMDLSNNNIPPALVRNAHESLMEALELDSKWNNTSNGCLRACIAPRFVLSCSEDLMIESADIAHHHGLVWHTHVSENPLETEHVRNITGFDNAAYFDHLGLLNSKSALAHSIWLTEHEKKILSAHGSTVMHCPSTNLKLGSGIADTHSLALAGVNIAIGSDGAPANNRLDIWNEMRLAGLLAQWKAQPGTVKPAQVFGWATSGGAKAMGQENQIGILRANAKADMISVHPNCFAGSIENADDIYTHLVYAASSADVIDVWVNGCRIVADHKLLTGDEHEIQREFISCRKEIVRRADVK